MSKRPDEPSDEELAERDETLAAIREGQADIKAGRFITNEKMKERSAEWLRSKSKPQ